MEASCVSHVPGDLRPPPSRGSKLGFLLLVVLGTCVHLVGSGVLVILTLDVGGSSLITDLCGESVNGAVIALDEVMLGPWRFVEKLVPPIELNFFLWLGTELGWGVLFALFVMTLRLGIGRVRGLAR